MAFSEILAERVAILFETQNVAFEEKRMFGGMAFMVDDKMCVGINEDALMVRLDPEVYADALKKTGVRQMDFTKRPMKGFIYVDEAGIATDDQLMEWLQLALEYNPKAKSSKKRKK